MSMSIEEAVRIGDAPACTSSGPCDKCIVNEVKKAHPDEEWAGCYDVLHAAVQVLVSTLNRSEDDLK